MTQRGTRTGCNLRQRGAIAEGNLRQRGATAECNLQREDTAPACPDHTLAPLILAVLAGRSSSGSGASLPGVQPQAHCRDLAGTPTAFLSPRSFLQQLEVHQAREGGRGLARACPQQPAMWVSCSSCMTAGRAGQAARGCGGGCWPAGQHRGSQWICGLQRGLLTRRWPSAGFGHPGYTLRSPSTVVKVLALFVDTTSLCSAIGHRPTGSCGGGC